MTQVLLYVYDLSNGLARALSLPLTGKQIDGIWHTSIVAYGKEVFYGSGVHETLPGMSHHGTPIQVIDCGQTEVPAELFQDYLDDIKEEYRADKYHLLNFNCNSFTQDVVGFLTGGKIPEWISNLPADFLSTPFGQQLKPRIDAMYGGLPVSGAGPDATGGLLSGILAQAHQPPPSASPQHSVKVPLDHAAAAAAAATSSISESTASSLFIVTNPAALSSALHSHPWSIAMLTCRRSSSSTTASPSSTEAITAFEQLAANEGSENKRLVDFLVIDVDVGKGKDVAAQLGVATTTAPEDDTVTERLPAFVFFKNGQQEKTLNGIDAEELEAAVIWHLAQAQEE